jgi:phage/conjugal plasmid C-4 type zinc finger TraR family protein
VPGLLSILFLAGGSMDIFDQAQELERLDRESALIRSKSALDTGGPEWINGVACCRECSDPIPPRRLEALPGVGLCLACQQEREV